MTLKSSELDDFDSFLDEVEADLNAPPITNGNETKEEKSTKMKPATLKSGVPLPTSPDLPRSAGRRRVLGGGGVGFLGLSDSKNPYDSYDPRNKAEDNANAPEKQPTSFSPARRSNVGFGKPRSSQSAATLGGDESPKLSTRTPFESKAPQNNGTRASSTTVRRSNPSALSSDYLGLGLEDSPTKTTKAADELDTADTWKFPSFSTTSLSVPSKANLPQSQNDKPKPSNLLAESSDDFFGKPLVYKQPESTKASESLSSNPNPLSTPARNAIEDPFLANILTGKGSTSKSSMEEPKPIKQEPNPQPAQPEEDFAATLLGGLQFGSAKKAATTKKSGKKVPRSGNTATEDNEDEDGNEDGVKSSRLRIPTHILDEEELKGMSSSVKSLYSNQLELIEASYKEQIATLTQSHQRKEEILKDEIRALHKDYEERIQRYKTQWQAQAPDNDAKSNQQISELVDQVKSLHKQTKWLLEETQNGQSTGIGNGNAKQLLDNLVPALESAVVPVIKSQLAANNQQLSQLLSDELTRNGGLTRISQADMDKLNAGAQQRFEEILSKMNGMNAGRSSELNTRMDEKMKDLARQLDTQFHHMVKLQKKYRNAIVKNVLGSMADSADSRTAGNETTRGQMKLQLKEFRKDLKRVLGELENRHEKIHKSQTTLETEQSQILNLLQNLSSWVQVNGARQTAATMGLLDNYASSVNVNNANRGGGGSNLGPGPNGLSLQTELELKLLREERNSFSEAVVQLNVEKRKLSDERIVFEQEKFKFDHDKNRLYELETLLNLKSTDLEEIKTKSDIARQEYQKLVSELTRKLCDFEHDAAKQREVIDTIEQKFRGKQQRLHVERVEVQREREFLRKLRHQMLCPNCLAHNPLGTIVVEVGDGADAAGALSANYRSRGDGLEFATSTNLDQIMLQMPLPFSAAGKFTSSTDDALLNRDIRQLDNMYQKYFTPTK